MSGRRRPRYNGGQGCPRYNGGRGRPPDNSGQGCPPDNSGRGRPRYKGFNYLLNSPQLFKIGITFRLGQVLGIWKMIVKFTVSM